MGKIIDLTGQKFGKLTVVSMSDFKKCHRIYWNCLCDCGNTAVVQGNNLKSGNSTNCGHCGAVRTKGMYGMNKYDLTGDFGKGWTTAGEEFWFDLEDYDKIKDYQWYYSKTSGYLTTHPHNYGKGVRFHRFIMQDYITEEKPIVDHICKPPKPNLVYDNRKANLRVCTALENSINRNKQRNNTSGVIGVWFDKRNKKWTAEIIVNKKKIYLGRYIDIKDAAKARKEAEIKYFGEYAFKGRENL